MGVPRSLEMCLFAVHFYLVCLISFSSNTMPYFVPAKPLEDWVCDTCSGLCVKRGESSACESHVFIVLESVACEVCACAGSCPTIVRIISGVNRDTRVVRERVFLSSLARRGPDVLSRVHACMHLFFMMCLRILGACSKS